jgi:alpha-amylase/alpha-mannosidase (GH57 family)
MEKYLCIHGHFYQPPRESAWLEEIEVQESAAPYHDWNERINAECYGPNSVSRILDGDGKIVDIVNNYAKISFNYGPTLLSWMREFAPATYQAIVEGDKASIQKFNGRGSAMAQVYNHIIMPLANRRDKETQIIWGIRDFEFHFGRKPEGMWLAETAVDIETLEVLAENDIEFTVLAPRQARRFRKVGASEWVDGVNPNKHYVCRLPSGNSIILFFYDGEVANAVAFKGLLKDGREFANYLLSKFNNADNTPQLVHIATDGESYGHHHRHGDMALAYCLEYIEENELVKLTNYSEYIHLFAPEYEVEIYENSSWSCVHGVERWRSNCGCNTGGKPGWTQAWRKPLREALDWLRDQLIDIYEEEMNLFHENPWALRNKYIDVILNRSLDNITKFLDEEIEVNLSELKRTHILRLLEMQRQALLMFTSCAWFFDEISGIETIQVLQYANRAIQLGERVSTKILEPEFLMRLQSAISNEPANRDGAEIYRKFTIPARVTLTKVGMHYAVASLFAEDIEKINVLNFHAENEHFERYEAGIQKIAIGRTTVYSHITLSRKYFSFVVLYLGQHQIIGSSSEQMPGKDFYAMAEKVKNAFLQSNIADVLQIMQNYFPAKNFSILELFKDEKIRVLNQILVDSLEQAEMSYQKIFDRNYNILTLMRNQGLTIPPALKHNLDVVINQGIESFFADKSMDAHRLQHLTSEVERWNVPLNYPKIALVASHRLFELVSLFEQDTTQTRLIRRANDFLTSLKKIQVNPQLNEVQNVLHRLSKSVLPIWYQELEQNENRQKDIDSFLRLCGQVNMRITVPQLVKY